MFRADHIVLCSTARLARSLRLSHGRQQAAQGLQQWQPLAVRTLAQWLHDTITQAMLAGDIPPDILPNQVLDGMAERLLWEQAISLSLVDDDAHALFDVAGMAQSAAEANALMLGWGVFPPAEGHSEEARQFLRWRAAFHKLCQQHQALEAASLFSLYTDCLERGAGRLPQQIELAGYDRISPQEQRLFDVLATRGVAVSQRPLGLPTAADAQRLACDDAEAECRAAVAWVAQKLSENPQAKLAIVVPELATLRAKLVALLDDTLHPQAIHPSHAAMPRCYDFTLGEPLADQPVVGCALALLGLAVRRNRLPQQEAGRLLREVYWSAGMGEADARARLEARLRRKLPASIRLEQLLRLARRSQLDGLPLSRLVQHLESLQQQAANWPRRQLPSGWARAFGKLLEAAGWPGERGLSSHEFQARQAWTETLAEFTVLDSLLGQLSPSQALSRLSRLCRERIFQPESERELQLQVMGMLEAAATPLDAVWVMGMNDHVWPPPARPNPLLPAEYQRRVGAPNSCSRVQAEFAQAIQRRLLHSAPQLVFSWARKEGERELRMSPLLAELAVADDFPRAITLAEQLAQPAEMQWLDDHRAPPVQEGEKVSGGAGLIRTQALCPAWAYYRYRLGARALEEPVEGLDAMQRGSLLHAVLQAFWDGRDSAWLQGMDKSELQATITQAVEQGIRKFGETLEEALPPHFLALEQLRLQRLLARWLELEKTRPPFAVEECERRVRQDIGGIEVDLVLDRVDKLPDGRLVVLDYKTGAAVSHKSWAEDRISEPQLPIYAALALDGAQVAAVCFAKLRADEQKFIGISAEAELLPGIKALDEARNLFPEAQFPDWAALIEHWQASIHEIAQEIRAGDAAVCFTDENDLRDCDVKPLLRLPERKLQTERGWE